MASAEEAHSPLKAPVDNGFNSDSYPYGVEGDVRVAVVTSQDRGSLVSGMRDFYTLPSLRFSTIVRAIILVDGIVSIALWLTGGNSEYFVDNIVNFHFRQSVFDLALLAALKCILGLLLYSLMEENALQRLDNPYQHHLTLRASLLHTFTIISFLLAFAYTVTKGSLILYSVLRDTDYKQMHAPYNALVISAVCFSLLELGLALGSFKAMKQLQRQRILHRINEQGVEVDKEGNPVKKKVTLLRLVTLAKPELPLIGTASASLLLSSGTQVVAPLFFGQVVDAAQKSMEDLDRTVLILLGIYAGGSIASMIRSWLFTLAGQRLVARLRRKLFSAVISQDVAFFDVSRTGELCNRLSSDTQVLQNAITVNVSMLARYLLQIIGSLALMFYLNAALTGVLLAVVPIVSFGAVQYGMFVKRLRQQFQDRLAEAGTTAEEALSSIRTVRMFSGETKTTANYNSDIDKSYAVGKKMALASGTFEGVLGFLSYGAVSLVLWYGGKLVYENHVDPTQGISAGIFTSFLLFTLQVAMAFALLSSLYGDFMQAVGASVRIFELLDRLPEIPNENGLTLPQLNGRVEFRNVRFTYPSRPDTEVLKNVTFTVEPGQMVALVGPSGGGKSTIVSLIERFYDPDSGTILLGNYDLKSLDPQWFRQKISMVSQEPTLFACSIKENIAFGRATPASDEEVIDAAKQANAHDFIMGFEKGYDTLVGERGVRLSGGQKQRVAIARALIMNPGILLLDEATSALDAESEHLVQDAIDRAMKGRTVIVIAHRLSTVRNADKVMVVDKGEIVEQGTHDSLLEKGGVYKRLVLRQLMVSNAPINASANADDQEDSHKDFDTSDGTANGDQSHLR